MGLDVGHRQDRLLGLDRQIARSAGSAGGHRLRGIEQLIVFDAAMRQADAGGLLTVHHLTEQNSRHGHLRTGDATQHPRVPSTRMQPDLQEAGVELGAARGQSHIAAQREVHARTHRGAVDRRKRRQRAAGDTKEALVDRTEARLPRLGKVAQVCTGTERRRGSGDHDGTCGLV